MSKISTIIIRLAYCALFFWFGTSQLIDPGAWTSFLPEFVGYIPIPGEMLVRFNGWAEVVAATMLLLGCYTRLVAGFLGAHLLAIALTVGGAIGVRDGVLGLTVLSFVFSKPDEWTLDWRSSQRVPDKGTEQV